MERMTGRKALISCDRYDYYVATFCGAAAGVLDVLFVGRPGASRLGELSGKSMDEIVKMFARLCGWKPSEGKDQIASAIGFLERKFPVSYDLTHAEYTKDGFSMTTRNHHVKSLAHHPDIIGLFFAIVDQFTDESTFVDDGRIIRLRSNGRELQGSNFVSKIVCGACNWFGHLLSDAAGSSGSRNGTGKGTGIPLPFYSLFLSCNFGSFQVGKDRMDLAKVMTMAFQEGYDLRHGIAASIPLVLNEILIRCFWALKRHYYHQLPFSECFPSLKQLSLHKMLIVGDGALCVIDGIVAGAKSGGNAVVFVLHLNLPAWGRLLYLVLKYLAVNEEKMAYEWRHEQNMAELSKLRKNNLRLQEELRQFGKTEQVWMDTQLQRLAQGIHRGDSKEVASVLYDFHDAYGKKEALPFKDQKEFDQFMISNRDVFHL